MSKLGMKFNKGIKRLGNKIDKTAHRLGHKANLVLNKSDRAIQTVNGVINKVDRGLQYADKMGAGALPYVGPVFEAVSKGIHGARKVTDRAKSISNDARDRVQDLTKFNSRKHAYEKLHDGLDDAFA